MKHTENIEHIVLGKHVITKMLLTWKILIIY